MDEKEQFERLNKYFNFSRWKYNFFLGGSKHFGYYPNKKWISTKKAQELMQDLVAEKLQLRKEMKVLDAGCGQGVTSTYIAKKYGCNVEGVTVVPFEIESANKLARQSEVSPLVNYSLMDYSNLKFADSYFDAVYTQESLVHSTNIEKTLNEFHRVLKTEGKIALFEYTMADDNKFSREELQAITEMNYASAMHSFSSMRNDKFKKLISDTGFRNVKVENINHNVSPMLESYEKFVKPIYYFLRIFGLTYKTPNLIAAARMVEFGDKDLVRYNIFTANK